MRQFGSCDAPTEIISHQTCQGLSRYRRCEIKSAKAQQRKKRPSNLNNASRAFEGHSATVTEKSKGGETKSATRENQLTAHDLPYFHLSLSLGGVGGGREGGREGGRKSRK